MRKLVSDSARHRFDLAVLAIFAILAVWLAGGFVTAGSCLGIAPPLPELSTRIRPACADSLPSARGLAGGLALMVVGGAMVLVMDRQLRR